MNKLTLYTKSGCHLCEKMKEDINTLKDEIKFDFEEINIENDNLSFNKYKEKIPVLFINKSMFAKYEVNILELSKRLKLNL